MALSFVQYSGDGSTQNFAVPFPYLSTNDIKVAVNGAAQSGLQFLSGGNTVRLSAPPAAGATIEIRRVTPRDTRLVDFNDGSVMTESDLDLANIQVFYIVQEAIDVAGGTLGIDADGSFNALGRRITNLAEPAGPKHAVTLQYYQGTFLPQLQALVTAATAARDNANTARDAASSSSAAAAQAKTDAVSASTASQAARDAAVTARDAASGAATGAKTSETNAAASKTAAATSEANATSAASSATTSASAAATSATDAGSSKTAAAGSASAAATSASAAGTSKTAAETAQKAAETARDQAQGAVNGNARGISFTPAGDLTANDVQAAIEQTATTRAPLASPTLTGVPKAPTAAASDNSTALATTAFVQAAAATRLRVDAAQTLSAAQRGQALANLGFADQPQGRLTLATGQPVMLTAVSAAGTVYYTPDRGNLVPLWNGSVFVMWPFAEVSQALSDATKSPAAAINSMGYDYFAWLDGTTVRVTRGPKWTDGATAGAWTAGGGACSRGAGAGSSALIRVWGLYVNQYAITNGPAAGFGTYLGTIGTDSAGATVSWSLGGAALGGVLATLNVFNAYQQRAVCPSVRDLNQPYVVNTGGGYRLYATSATMRVNFVLGLQADSVTYSARTNVTTGANAYHLAVSYNGAVVADAYHYNLSSAGSALSVSDSLPVPSLGAGSLNLVEASSAAVTVNSVGSNCLNVQLAM